MALVANYSSASDSEDDEQDDRGQPGIVITPVGAVKTTSVRNHNPPESMISDDEEEYTNDGAPSMLDEVEEDIPGLSSNKTLFSSLPTTAAVSSSSSSKDFVDADEDLSTIPKAKDSEKASVPLKKKKRTGPVRIILPMLSESDFDEGPSEKKPKVTAASKKSALLTLLPAPKNAVAATSFAPASLASKVIPNRGLLVPDAVARRQQQQQQQKQVARPKMPHSDSSDSDDGDTQPSFFTLEQEKIHPLPVASVTSANTLRVNAIPHAPGPADRPLAFKGLPTSALIAPEEDSWTAPEVGPARPSNTSMSYYPEPEDLMANEDAINRLAGKHALKNKEEISVVDVKASSLTADPREWLTKALTEDDPDKPGPRCTVKGQTKKKHQITYLAALAKENEHKLKEEWSRNAATKKAAGAKYGF